MLALARRAPRGAPAGATSSTTCVADELADGRRDRPARASTGSPSSRTPRTGRTRCTSTPSAGCRTCSRSTRRRAQSSRRSIWNSCGASTGSSARTTASRGEPPTPYIAAWHQAPFGTLERVRGRREDFALHLELFTIRRTSGKLKFLAGSESGMNVFINDVPPEAAAERLREVASSGSEHRKYLVTGGAGYVGSVVAAHLLEAGHEVDRPRRPLHRLPRGRPGGRRVRRGPHPGRRQVARRLLRRACCTSPPSRRSASPS